MKPPWERFAGRPYAPKQPVPEHGVRMKVAGATWWGLRWIEALEKVLRGDAGRLARGKTYARAGRAHDLVVDRGTVRALVTGTRPSPYQVTIRLAQLPDAVWSAVIATLAAQARFAAELLAGRMPQQIDDVFRAAQVSLFPATRAELATECSCPDTGDPCKHVAATHYLLGEALDRDPFLLFELRGRSREQVLAGLRAARGGEALDPGSLAGDAAASEVASVTLEPMPVADYDQLREPLPVLELSFAAPVGVGALLRQLGAPPGWRDAESPADALAPLVRSAAEAARRLALGEPEPDLERAPDALAPTRRAAKKPASKKKTKRAPRRTARTPRA